MIKQIGNRKDSLTNESIKMSFQHDTQDIVHTKIKWQHHDKSLERQVYMRREDLIYSGQIDTQLHHLL